MSSAESSRERAPAAPQAARRQVTLPGSAGRPAAGVRGGLLLLGLVLVAGSGLGFWFVLQSVDERHEYLMARRTIERWEVVDVGDFDVVEASVGSASAMAVPQVVGLIGQRATGRIPAGTIVTRGMFEATPLSEETSAGKVLIEVELPAGEAPFGSLEAGDRVALFGAEPRDLADPLGGESPRSLIGVLTLEHVRGDGGIIYIVTPAEARAIMEVVDRYAASADRRMWKVGADLATDELSGPGPAEER